MKKNLIKSMAFAIAAILLCTLQSCTEEFSFRHVKDGLPAKINLKVTVPSATSVINTRAAEDVESEVKDLWLVMFSKHNHRIEIIDLTNLSENGRGDATTNANNGYREYTFDITGIQTKTGDYTAYLLANATSNFCGLTKTALQSVTTKEDFEALMANAAEKIQITGTNRIPMVAKIDDVTIQEGSTTVTIKATLERLMSRIEFYLIDGTPDGATFTPKSYQVYNVPKKANLVSKPDNQLSEVNASNYFNSDEVNLNMTDVPTTQTYNATTTPPAFSFLMLENVRPAGSATSNADREAWDATQVPSASEGNYNIIDPKDKAFTKASEYSTFVVINGVYEGKSSSEAGANSYRGNVSYTVHLGDFTTNKTNFTVNRNELHKYRITVSGVSTITAESIVTDVSSGIVPGAEGVLIKSSNNFVLDAHYESLILEFTAAEIQKIKDKWDDKTMTVGVKSPCSNLVYTLYPQSELKTHDNLDYTWLIFVKPKEDSTIPRFPGYKYRADGTLILDTDTDSEAQAAGARGTDGWVDQVLLNSTYPAADDNADAALKNSTLYGPKKSVVIGYLNDFCENPWPDKTTGDGLGFTRKVTRDGTDYYQVAVYVDEYVYSTANPKNPKLDIDKWVNTDDRVFILNPQEVAISGDQQSVVYNNFIFSIAQRSIKTPYNLEEIKKGAGSAFNSGFGLETWAETSDLTASIDKIGVSLYSPLESTYTRTFRIKHATNTDGVYTYTNLNFTADGNMSPNTGATYHEVYGRLNTIALHDVAANRIPWDYFKYAGYNNLTGHQLDNSTASHTWNAPSDYNAIQAVLMRNLDLNGNGVIDDNEVRWYMPAMAQYYTIWIAQTAMDPETYLMDLSKFYVDNYQRQGEVNQVHYYTSSYGKATVYYQDQGVSIGIDGVDKRNQNYVRAVRNIPEFDMAPEFPVDATDKGNRIIKVEGVDDEYLRLETYTRPFYPFHVERDYYNNLPPKFQVFQNIIRLGASNTAISDSDKRTIADLVQVNSSSTSASVAANLQTLYDTFIKGKLTTEQQAQGWRIPNQRELMLLYRYGYLTDNDSTNPLRFYLSCTYYTHNPSSYPSRTHDQIMDDTTALGYPKSRPFTTINGLMSLNDYGPHWAGGADVYVVLVRDAD